MSLTVHCPRCAKPLRVADELTGKGVRCPGCKEPFVVSVGGSADAVSPSPREGPDEAIPGERLDATLADALPARAPAEQLPFEHLGHYRVVRRIGRGGMGDVYLGYEESLGRRVALKVLPAEHAADEVLGRRFHAEAAAVARLAHPNLVPVYFVGREGAHHFFAMQYVDGESLEQRLARQGRLEANTAADILEQCLGGLGAAHQASLVHRDVKPGNILLETGTGRALLADFGLAKLVGAGAGPTRAGVVVGTMSYLSPEQARGEAVDHRSDLYSLGVVAYRMLSGRLPFDSHTPSGMLFQHAYEAPRPLREAAPEVPAGLEAIVMRLLAKEPAHRYCSSAEALADLRRWRAQSAPALPQQQEGVQRPPSRLPPQPRGDPTEALPAASPLWPRRRLLWVGAALLLLAGTLTALLWPRHAAQGSGETASDRPPPVVKAAEGPGAPGAQDRPAEGKIPPLAVPPANPAGAPAPGLVAAPAGARQLALCSGHSQTVWAVAVSLDGRRLLSGSQDKSARLWDRTGKLLRASTEPTYWVQALAFSPDGRLAVSPRDPSALRVWDVETGKEQCQFTGHKVNVRCAVFSADGRRVFSGGPDGGLSLWNATDGSAVHRFLGQAGGVSCVALSRDGRWAVSGSSAGALTVWDLATRQGRSLPGHRASTVVGVGFWEGRGVVSADTTRTIRLWDRTGRLRRRQIKVNCVGQVQQVAFSPLGDRALCACDDGTLRLIDLNASKETACLRGHNGGVTAVAFSPDGRLAVSGGKDRTVRLWKLPQ